MDAHGGALVAFWGSRGPKSGGLACGELGQEPLTSLAWHFGSVTLEVFGLHDLGEFWALEPMARFCGSFGAWRPKFKKKTTSPCVREEFLGLEPQ